AAAPEIPAPPIDQPQQFTDTWSGYGAEQFLNYGRLPGNRFMINWPQQGNDYGVDLNRLIGSPTSRQEFLQEAYWHSQSYARFLQSQLGRRYGLATEMFPRSAHPFGHPSCGGAFALHPYYRESRRLQGLVTVREQDLLPLPGGQVAALPQDKEGTVESIALGNYANDHHYPGYEFPLAPKSIRWGGRWTGTPFTLPYRCLVPDQVDGVLGCEKNISVSHIANGATRLQPVVLGIGQAVGMAAALCIEQQCQPRELSVSQLQTALLTDPIAPATLVPLFNLGPQHPNWLEWQRYYLAHPDRYPPEGIVPAAFAPVQTFTLSQGGQEFAGMIECGEETYRLQVQHPEPLHNQTFQLVTLQAEINQQFQRLENKQRVQIWGVLNRSGNWIRVEQIKEA
ncbi:MAG TPA: FAD-dependent oxidoreductase, partial [Cyanophyceae cyanobacterium]